MKFKLIIANSRGETHSFPFTVREHPAALHWLCCLKKAAAESEIYEGRRWYNFSKNT